MEEIVQKYNQLTSPNKKLRIDLSKLFEFELRFKKQPRHIFSEVAVALKEKHKPQLKKELKIVNKGNIRQIMQYDPATNEKLEDFFEKKTRLKHVQFPHYSAVVSEEAKADRFEPTNDSIFRIINRLSFPHGDWSIDLSAVCQVTDNIAQVKSKKDAMFEDVRNIGAFYELYTNADILPIHNLTNAYEIEVEYTGKRKLTVRMVEDIAEATLKAFPPEYFQETKIQNEIYKLARLIKPPELAEKFATKLGFKSLGNNARTLTMDDYMQYWMPTGHYFTIKADGLTTYFAVYPSEPKRAKILTSSNVDEIALNGNFGRTCIVCEKVDDQLLAWDIILWKGERIFRLPLSRRLQFLEQALTELKIKNLTLKPFFRIGDDIRDTIKLTMQARKEAKYSSDGYIMAIDGEDFNKTKWFKIKEKNTIDFLAVKCPSVMLGKEPHRSRGNMVLYLLFNGINTWEIKALGKRLLPQYEVIFGNLQERSSRIPIQFSPSDKPDAYLWYVSPDLDKKLSATVKPGEKLIVELYWDLARKEWRLERIRDDRKNERNYFGNSFVNVAEPNWLAINENIRFEELAKPQTGYFASEKNEMYRAQTAFNSYVKSQLIEDFARNANWVLDLGCGKGQDIQRYMANGVKNGIFLDIDRFAINKLVNKRFSIMQDHLRQNRHTPAHRRYNNMATYVVVQDLLKPHMETYEKVVSLSKSNRIDVIVWNFGIHYMMSSPRTVANTVKLLTKFAPKIKGKKVRFMFTAFDGQRMFEFLRDLKQGEGWEIYQDAVVLKYQLTKMYAQKQLDKTGQKIGVKLPFSGDKLYEEYLVNFKYLVSQLEANGWTLIAYKGFAELFDSFARANPTMWNKLSEDDKTYISLYSMAVLER